MESPILAAAAGAAAMLLLVVVVLTVTRRRRSWHDLEAMLAAAQQESDALRQRLEELTTRPVLPQQRTHSELRAPEQADFVITHVGEAGLEGTEASEAVAVPDRLVLSATLGEPLVKVAAFSHGVRRALSAESRNRIWFEMRREVRRARKQRRREMKDAWRRMQAEDRAA
jgi:hypothetical protein